MSITWHYVAVNLCEKWPNVVGKSELDRQNCENFQNVVKKLHFGRSGKKSFGRSVKNFDRPGQF